MHSIAPAYPPLHTTMPRVQAGHLSKQGHATFDMSLLDPATLREEDAIDIAISIVESHLRVPNRRDTLLRALMEAHNRIGFVLSGRTLVLASLQILTILLVLSDDLSTSLNDWLVETFPSKPRDFASSLASHILLHLSQQFWALAYPRVGLDECHRAVDLALPVLRAIPLMSFPNDEAVEEVPEDLDFGFVVKRKSQRQKKAARRNNRIPFVDPKPFDNLGVEVPTSLLGAEELARGILDDQKRILQVCDLFVALTHTNRSNPCAPALPSSLSRSRPARFIQECIHPPERGR